MQLNEVGNIRLWDKIKLNRTKRMQKRKYTLYKKYKNQPQVYIQRFVELPDELRKLNGVSRKTKYTPHITIIHSKKWNRKVIDPLTDKFEAKIKGFEVFNGNLLVALIDSPELHKRFRQVNKLLGTVSDFPTYKPHVTLGEVGRSFNLYKFSKKHKSLTVTIMNEEITFKPRIKNI